MEVRVHDRPSGHVHGRQPATEADRVRSPREFSDPAARTGRWDVAGPAEIERLNQSIGLQRTNMLVQRSREAALAVAQRAPIAPPLPKGTKTKSWSLAAYIGKWEKKHGRALSPDEKTDLERGCIGITNLNLNSGSVDPPLEMSFSTFAQAAGVAKSLNSILKSKPTLAKFEQLVKGHKQLGKLNHVVSSLPSGDPAEWKAVIFSKRFYSNQDPDWDKRKTAKPGAFAPNATTGQVDMSSYKYLGRPEPGSGTGAEYTNFDYGWFDEETNSWWHANHAEPGMKVYQSTLEYYSRPLLDFDKQVFSVAFARK